MNLEQLVQQQQQLKSMDESRGQPHTDSQEDLMQKEFIKKRQTLLDDQMRVFSKECFNICASKNVVGGLQKFSENVDFSPIEEICIDRCLGKVKIISQITERHLDDVFTPAFYHRYI
eukprot:403359942